MDEAEENGFIDLHIFIDSIISDTIIKQNCHLFGQGIFSLGIGSTMGTFIRKFSDISIRVESTKTSAGLLEIL